ncbi:RagB/SusD family nutrient uptake outer membrane protein [Pedobacter sp.]
MMTNIQHILSKKIMMGLMMALLITSSSCKKFLDTTAEGVQTNDKFFKTQAQLNAALNSAYAVLTSSALYGNNMLGRMGLDADHGFSTNATDLNDVGAYNVQADDAKVLAFWKALYSGINQANLVLENIDKPEMDNVARAKIKGQALFLRGYYHFLLASNFGDVPMVLTSAINTTELFPARTPIAQVYQQILADMQAAADLVDDIQTLNYGGKVTKSAAWGILARVCLQMAGQPLNDASKYTHAMNWAKKVIDATAGHSLNNSYEQVFINYAQDKYDIKESIWEVEFWSDGGSANGSNAGLVGINNGIRQTADANIGYASGYVHPTKALYDLYEEQDKRRDWNIANFYYSGYPAEKINWLSTAIYERNTGKFRREYETVTPKQNGRSPQNFPLLRFADVLLMYAEAVNQLNNGPTTEVINYVNQIRRRSIILTNTGKLKSIDINNGGKDYATAPLVIISGGGGTGARATANISAGQITSITITDAGSGYTSAPSISFFGSGTGATATATIYTGDETNLIPSQTATKAVFLTAIKKERSRELAFELLRKADLVRWGDFYTQMQTVLMGIPTNSGILEIEAARKYFTAVEQKDVLWPIPLQERRLNTKLTQNFGW